MVSTDLTALIVESEYIIALDIMMVLENQGISGATIARSAQHVHSLPADIRRPSLAIVEIEVDKTAEQSLVIELAKSGSRLICVSADSRIGQLLPDFADVPILIKPVPEAQLVAALQSVMGD